MKKIILILSLFVITIYISLFAYETSQTDFFQEFRLLKQVCYIIDQKYYKKIEPKKTKEKAETSEISALTENKKLEVPKQESKKSAKDWGRASNDPRNKG